MRVFLSFTGEDIAVFVGLRGWSDLWHASLMSSLARLYRIACRESVRGMTLLLAVFVILAGMPRFELHAHMQDIPGHAHAAKAKHPHWHQHDSEHGHDHARSETTAQAARSALAQTSDDLSAVMHMHDVATLTASILPSVSIALTPAPASTFLHFELPDGAAFAPWPPPFRPPIV